MGVNYSKKNLCINYDDAVKRVTDSELRRIREAFKRSAGASGTTLSKNVFVQDVLGEGVPNIVADWLFNACGGTPKGIAFKELLCGLVLLTKGTQDEKIKFLWTLYSNDSGTHILKTEFQKAIQTEITYQSEISNNNNNNNNLLSNNNQTSINNNNNNNNYKNILLTLFGQTDRITFDQFKSWIQIHKGATILSKWLLQESYISLSSELETPTFYQSLAGVTHLEEQDICDLEKVFWMLKGSSYTGQLDLESLGPLISPPVPVAALNGVFSAFDENRDGHIDFKELCCGVSCACRGPSVERSKFCFKIFDTDRDGVLSFSEIEQMIHILILVAKESNNNVYRNLQYEQVLNELYKRTIRKSSYSNSSEETTPDKDEQNTECGQTTISEIPEFKFSQENFLLWTIESEVNLLQPFLDLLFEVSHIVLGLRPQCKHLEHDIVKGWLSREVRRGLKIGQFWYLIASDWWQTWLQYTQSTNSSSNCSHCKAALNYNNHRNNVDEAMICDESFASNSTESMGDLLGQADSSSLGSGSSGISYGRHSGPPGPIDNNSLIAPNTFKNVPKLTGEGGRLRRDSTLAQHRDFEIVPESLWKALQQWYGGLSPLPRQVIQPPNSTELDLELYPLNLRILQHQQPQQQQQHSNSAVWSGISGGYGALSSGSYANVSNVTSILTPPKKSLAYTAAFSRLATVKQVAEFLCARLKLRVEDIRLWHIISSENSDSDFTSLLEEENLALCDLGITDNDQILLEIRNKDLTWPEELSALTLSQNNHVHNNQERRPTLASVQSVHPPGATGLHNLGNTCFMNAALQVLFNTSPLTQYFRKNMHLYELNTTNKLGTKGQLAVKYSELLKEVWTASTRSVAPLKLRFCVTKYAPQFSGGGQHDSQELLDWLLDSLHEDLNRVMEKPYTELKDSNGRADEIVAHEAWNLHHSRNQSIIVDLFYGQLKSKVSCLTCGHESVRFDPFSLLSLPLPVENYVYCEVLVTLLDGSVPIKYGLRLNSESRYYDLKHKMIELCGLQPEQMLICELSNSQIKLILTNELKLKPRTATELYIYELPKFLDCSRSRTGSELGVNIEKGLKDIQRSPALLMSSLEQNQLTTTSSTSSSSYEDNGINGQQKQLLNTSSTSGLSSATSSPSKINCRTTTKHSTEISTSPVSTFIINPTNNLDNKQATTTTTVSTTNLLYIDNNSPSEHPNNLDIEIKKKKESNKYNLSVDYDEDDDTISSSVILNSNNDHNFYQQSLQQKQQPENTNPNNNNNNNNLSAINSNSFNINHRKANYLIAVHRKLSRQDTYFLSHHKSRPSLFGVPLLIPCQDGVTNKEFYCSVWVQVARLLSPLPPTEQSNHATDCDDSLGYDFPFTLRAVADGGRICALCPWSKFCRGCEIPCNDEPLLNGLIFSTSRSTSNSSTPNLSSREQTPNFVRKNYSNSETSSTGSSPNNKFQLFNSNTINIAIDWDPTALHLRYQSTREREWTEHESVAICRKQKTEPVDLDHCLRAFTSEEELEQSYHCSNCKSKQPATKKLQIWKLPPILIVHLKRFNFVNNKWVKSQKVVNFPYENFEPTPYLASVPQETILRHKELLEYNSNNNLYNHDCNDEIIDFDREMSLINEINENSDGDVDENCTDEVIINNCDNKTNNNLVDSRLNKQQNRKSSTSNNINNNITGSNMSINNRKYQRKRLVSSSLLKTPVVDGEFIDFHNHKLKSEQDPFDLKYQLYAVVCHSGMLNGGHYISYASNPNGLWYCYNDSSCREIQTRPNIDPSTAYLLFYERKNLDYSPYLPKVDGKYGE
uniref:ubiquitinyl hydrolase 1 n=1 Tax=Corethrella appendiculata TaxID=1370023 RepID=W4VR89_9DIPT